MPNLKVYVEQKIWEAQSEHLQQTLLPLRELLCKGLDVAEDLCQVAIVPFQGVEGQAAVSVEMQILQKLNRTQESVAVVCRLTQELLASASGVKTSVRATSLDPATYVTVR